VERTVAETKREKTAMVDVLGSLKSRARVLHRKVEARDPVALRRLRSMPAFAKMDDDAITAELRRRHCLSVIARELGFTGWSHAAAVLSGRPVDDFGTMLYPKELGATFWNVWSASYDEARQIRKEHGGYLLAYKKHFFIVDRYFIEAIGIDPDDEDWTRIRRDWARPGDLAARNRLYGKLIEARQATAS